MRKNISARTPSKEEQIEAVKERDEYIRANKYTTFDRVISNGGITVFGTVVVVGEKHKEASEWLHKRLNSTYNVKDSVDYKVQAERKFDVQIWEDARIIELAKSGSY